MYRISTFVIFVLLAFGAAVSCTVDTKTGPVHSLSGAIGSDGDADSDTDTDADSDCSTDPDPDTGCVYYVDIDAAPDGNGLSWATAYDDIQEGIESAWNAGLPHGYCEVWVAQGTYYMYQSNPNEALHLRRRVAVYGGFDGTESLREERDWWTNVTTVDGRQMNDHNKRVHHVVRGADDAVIDGFTITQGGGPTGIKSARDGAGIYNVSQSLF